MSSFFIWADVFVVGIGLDLAGASLLAMGGLLGDRQALLLSQPRWGWHPAQVISRVEDKITGKVGVITLFAGFGVQLGGYVSSFVLPFDSTVSPARGAGALIVVVITMATVHLLYRAILPPWRRHRLIQIARLDDKLDLGRYPYAVRLVRFAESDGMSPQLEGESDADYARRVWNVRNLIEDDPPES